MNAIYPSRKFFSDAKSALKQNLFLQISINGGWRGRLLAKEVEHWPSVAEGGVVRSEAWKAPSILCNLLMIPLLTIHYAALSAAYEMRCKLDGDSVILTYIPL